MDGAKQSLREQMTVARLRLSPADRAAFSHAIADRVVALDAFERARTVGVYAAMGAEVETIEIAQVAAARGVRVAYPRLVGGERALRFAACGEGELCPGPLRTRQPPPGAAEIPLGELDAVLVPGLAFDARGWRLGRGGGHYDATLAALPARAARLGLAFAAQMVPAVPHEGHDRPLDVVVTETGVHLCAGARDAPADGSR